MIMLLFLSMLFFVVLEGAALPVTCNPSSSQRQRPQPSGSAKKQLPKVMNAKHLSGGVRTKDAIDEQQALQTSVVPVPPKGSEYHMQTSHDHRIIT